MHRTGELAALGTALCWGVTSLGFEAAGRRVGSLAVNLIRLVIGLALLSALGWLIRGRALPTDATGHAWAWLSLSGLSGFAFGDMCLFRALVVLGARRSSLVMSTAPMLAAILSWLLLGESMSPLDVVGMVLTVSGVALAVSERSNSPRTPRAPAPAVSAAMPVVSGASAPVTGGETAPGHRLWRGLALAAGGALGQAGGLVLSKQGMGSYHPLAATQIRIIAGIAGFSLVFSAVGWWPRAARALGDRRGMAFIALGALFGPAIGVSLSLYAIQHAVVGVAASIMATTPIWIIPMVALVHRERTTVRGLLGAVLAVAGVATLLAVG